MGEEEEKKITGLWNSTLFSIGDFFVFWQSRMIKTSDPFVVRSFLPSFLRRLNLFVDNEAPTV